MAGSGSTMAEKRLTPTGLNVEHYVAVLVLASILLLWGIGRGIVGVKVPLTNVRVGQ
jgi:hypothetical protein